MTPVRWAIEREEITTAALLVKFGANIEMENESGETMLLEAVKGGKKKRKLIKILSDLGADMSNPGSVLNQFLISHLSIDFYTL